MKYKAFTLVRAILILAGLGLVAALLVPVYKRVQINLHPYGCQSNLKQIGMAIRQYVQDNNGKFPLVSAGSQGWVDSLQPYCRTYQLFQCPTENSGNLYQSSDYFINARVAGVREEKLDFIDRIILCGDGLDDAGTNANITELLFDWSRDETAPARRHSDGANYLFADGHINMRPLASSKISNESPRGKSATFAIK